MANDLNKDINRVMKSNAFLNFCADDIDHRNAGDIVEGIVTDILGIDKGIYSRCVALGAINRLLTWR